MKNLIFLLFLCLACPVYASENPGILAFIHDIEKKVVSDFAVDKNFFFLTNDYIKKNFMKSNQSMEFRSLKKGVGIKEDRVYLEKNEIFFSTTKLLLSTAKDFFSIDISNVHPNVCKDIFRSPFDYLDRIEVNKIIYLSDALPVFQSDPVYVCDDVEEMKLVFTGKKIERQNISENARKKE